MKFHLLILLFFPGQFILAQPFMESIQLPPFAGVYFSATAFADIDGDSDYDLLISGYQGGPDLSTILYTNDGDGNFSEVADTPFEGLNENAIAFADIDGDDDQDLFIAGYTADALPLSKLYTNDGNGNFTEVIDSPFEDIYRASVAFADVDGDNDQDLLISGETGLDIRISKLYTNDGDGNFSEVMGTSFIPVALGSVAFADIDNDDDQDLLITGRIEGDFATAKLYKNDGFGNFTEVMNSPIQDVWFGSVAFEDMDGDDDLDLILTGNETQAINNPVSKFYTNDGAGNFMEVLDTPFHGVFRGSMVVADIDGDNDQDVLITGDLSGFDPISKLYLNDGLGNFEEVLGTPFEGVYFGAAAIADVDGDIDQDILITGFTGTFEAISKLYINDFEVVPTAVEVTEQLPFNFTIFPNPAVEDIVNINLIATEHSPVTLGIFDLYGRLLIEQQEQLKIGQQTYLMNISDLNKGQYIIEVNDGERIVSRKFLIQ